MKSFIRVVESWVPGKEPGTLELGGGIYGSATAFGEASRGVRFAKGEGLPGQAWQQARPIVLKSFEGSYFQRTEIAHAEGLTCGIAVPIFSGSELRSVVLLFCGDEDESAGAIELWCHDPAEAFEMNLADGYYGKLAEAFEFISRRTAFRKGSGLPGLTWGSGLPVFFEDLGKGSRFLRADTATKVGINRGFAIPCAVPGPSSYVMAFLSALGTPIVRRFESWQPDAGGDQLLRTDGFCETVGALPALAIAARGEGAICRAFTTGTPAFSSELAAEPDAIGEAAVAAGMKAMVALPIIHGSRVGAVVTWYF